MLATEQLNRLGESGCPFNDFGGLSKPVVTPTGQALGRVWPGSVSTPRPKQVTLGVDREAPIWPKRASAVRIPGTLAA